jgi:hypothetical protein
MYAPTRNEAREFFFAAWEKYGGGAPLTELERMAVEIIALHPEYHAMLAARDRHGQRDYTPEDGALNPFLHLSLHLGIAEQVAADRPAGVRGEIERLTRKHDDAHKALHEAVECLGETMWEAQRTGASPDPATFIECLRRK